MDRENPAGNYVLITCKGVEILLVHLRSGSITLEKGDRLNKGQPLGQVGNSGNTSEPHLHIEAQKAGTGNSVLEGEGVPMIFNNRFLVRNSLVY